jgi:hypothetical protein
MSIVDRLKQLRSLFSMIQPISDISFRILLFMINNQPLAVKSNDSTKSSAMIQQISPVES